MSSEKVPGPNADPPPPAPDKSSDAPTRALPPREGRPERVGDYKILEILGEGGMGIVYLAEQERPLRRRVALKVVKLTMMDAREVLARFEVERQVLAILDHPNVAKVFDAGVASDGRPFFVMEHVRGVPITTYCDDNRLELPKRLDLFLQICAAVQHAHQKGIIHRDLKPSNVLVSVGDSGPAVKVIDFGVAKATEQRLTEKTLYTERGLLIGTPEYMSPEQAGTTALDVDTRTDIYSLGVLLYELLVGELPFDFRRLREAGYLEMVRVLHEEEPQRPSTRLSRLGEAAAEAARRRRTDAVSLQRHLRGDLDWITFRAMEKDRTRRYASASELAADIERHLRSEPVSAGPPTIRYRAGKFLRRHRGGAAAALAVLGALLGGLVLSTVLYLRAESARQIAEWNSYVANIRAAEFSLRTGEVAAAKRQLAACGPQLRNWEWRYLVGETDSSSGVVTGTTAPRKPRFSPDGGQILWFEPGAIQIRAYPRLDSARTVPVELGGATSRVVALDPAGAVAVVATQADAGSGPMTALHAIEVPSLRPVREVTVSGAFLEGVIASSWVFSRDGSTLAGTVLRDAQDQAGTGSAWPFRRQVLTWRPSGADSAPRLWAGPFNIAVDLLAVGPNGWPFALGISDDLVLLTDSEQVYVVPRVGGKVYAASFSPDGTQIAVGTADGVVRLWGVPTLTLLRAMPGHNGAVVAIEFSADGTRIVSGSADNTIRIWDAEEGFLLATHRGHEMGPSDVAFSPDGRRVVSASRIEDEVRLWDAGRSTGSARITTGVECFAVSSDGESLVIGGEDRVVRVVDRKGNVVHAMEGHEERIVAVGFAPDGRWLFSGSTDGELRLWDGRSGLPLATLTEPEGIASVSVGPDGDRLVSGSLEGTLRVWDPGRARQIGEWRGHEGRIDSLAFDPGGRWIASASAERVPGADEGEGPGVRVWEAASHALRHSLVDHAASPVERRVGFRPESISFSPDGSRLAVAAYDGTVSLWDPGSGRLVGRLVGHQFAAWSVGWSRDGSRLVTGGTDGTCRIWDPRRQELLLILRVPDGNLREVGFSPEGEAVFAVDRDSLIAWHASGSAARVLASAENQAQVDRMFLMGHPFAR